MMTMFEWQESIADVNESEKIRARHKFNQLVEGLLLNHIEKIEPLEADDDSYAEDRFTLLLRHSDRLGRTGLRVQGKDICGNPAVLLRRGVDFEAMELSSYHFVTDTVLVRTDIQPSGMDLSEDSMLKRLIKNKVLESKMGLGSLPVRECEIIALAEFIDSATII